VDPDTAAVFWLIMALAVSTIVATAIYVWP
jgi:hypothetical protein